ncbi:hypothetical protein MF628_08810 [Paenibacillus polymyxa]|uniref:hypothetical protein n=1 Tax=Paenibacillus polymyxa TaxID=1406 RepID=UPI002024F1B6|nr:hypothetical protein [Paenibacillus polymyxa]WDZ63583.1 hypothetical protein MF628_08810 [Paenibacillus polymyxa]
MNTPINPIPATEVIPKISSTTSDTLQVKLFIRDKQNGLVLTEVGKEMRVWPDIAGYRNYRAFF